MRTLSAPLLAAALFLAAPCAALAETVSLPAPDTSGGLPLMQALAQRQTTRSLSSEPLDQTTLGNLLWAAWGQNRPDGKRTAPSARNRQALKQGGRALAVRCRRAPARAHRREAAGQPPG